MTRLSYEKLLESTQNSILRKLFKIMIDKQTNLCIAANFETTEQLVQFIDKVGKHVCIIKTQVEDMGGGPEIAKILKRKKEEHNFLIFEDRKFGVETKKTIQSQYAGSYVGYADFVTVLPDERVIEAIETVVESANISEPRGCLVLCETSFETKIKLPSPQESLELAKSHKICAGVIAQKLQVSGDIIKLSPGVHLKLNSDGLDQCWRHPSEVIADGTDIVIVGRGITGAPEEEHEKITCLYKDAAWQAYKEQINKSYSSV